jgi:hypothetical protein
MNRPRALVCLALFSGLAFSNWPRSADAVSAAAVVTTVDINIGGGYALVFGADEKSLHVGSIAPPTTAEQKDYHYQPHPLRLTLERGDFDIRASSIPPTNVGEGGTIKLGWDLTGYVVRVAGTDNTHPRLTAPPSNPERIGCSGNAAPQGTGTGNLAFSTLISSLAPSGRTLRTDWRNELNGRLVLTNGAFDVVALASGCVDYVNAKQEVKHQQRIPSGKVSNLGGEPGLRYRTTRDGEVVNLEFVEYATGTAKGRVALKAGAGGRIELNLDPRLPGTYTPEQLRETQQHFEMFYRLLTPPVPKADRLLARWSGPTGLSPVTPGEGCGGARFRSTKS